MSELQQNRYDRLIRRIGGIIGPGSKVSEVLTELFPMIDVEGDRGELQILAGVRLGMAAHTLAGVAAQRSKIQLFNPLDSGMIVTVTDLFASSTTTQILRLGRSTIALSSGIGTQLSRDTRFALANRPTAAIFSENSVPQVGANILFSVIANVNEQIKTENGVMILSPGNGLAVGCPDVNTTLSVTFFWRERVAEISELKF